MCVCVHVYIDELAFHPGSVPTFGTVFMGWAQQLGPERSSY